MASFEPDIRIVSERLVLRQFTDGRSLFDSGIAIQQVTEAVQVE